MQIFRRRDSRIFLRSAADQPTNFTVAMSGLLVLTEPIHRPFQTIDGRFQSCRHPFQLADGVVDLTGSCGVKVATAVAGDGMGLAPQLIHQLSQVGPADMERSLQFRPTDAVFPAGAGVFEVCQQLFIAHVFSFPG